MKKEIVFLLFLCSLFSCGQNRIESLKNIAQKGDSEAQYLLGICYLQMSRL